MMPAGQSIGEFKTSRITSSIRWPEGQFRGKGNDLHSNRWLRFRKIILGIDEATLMCSSGTEDSESGALR